MYFLQSVIILFCTLIAVPVLVADHVHDKMRMWIFFVLMYCVHKLVLVGVVVENLFSNWQGSSQWAENSSSITILLLCVFVTSLFFFKYKVNCYTQASSQSILSPFVPSCFFLSYFVGEPFNRPLVQPRTLPQQSTPGQEHTPAFFQSVDTICSASCLLWASTRIVSSSLSVIVTSNHWVEEPACAPGFKIPQGFLPI